MKFTKLIIVFASFYTVPVCVYAQHLSITKPVVRIEIPKVEKSTFNANTEFIEMNFNSSSIANKFKSINPQTIVSISLVYTQFKLNETFNQSLLNKNRLNQLYDAIPQLKENKEIQWYWIAQTDCNSTGECHDFFHGFIIQYKDPNAEIKSFATSMLLEYYSYIRTNLEKSKKIELILDSLIATGKTGLVKTCADLNETEYITPYKNGSIRQNKHFSKKQFLRKLNKLNKKNQLQNLTLIKNKKGALQFQNEVTPPMQKFLIKNLVAYPFKGKKTGRLATKYTLNFILNSKNEIIDYTYYATALDLNGDTIDKTIKTKTKMVRICTYADTNIKSEIYTYQAEDVVTKVFNRNTDWQNCLIAVDVTGSMSPYVSQFQLWLQMDHAVTNSHKNYVFFNDGDNKLDMVKKTGKVGGIYYIKSTNPLDIKSMAQKAMSAGNGSDCPENNIEAIIYGLEKEPLKEVILIADNWATPRDLMLLDKVKVPIHIVLCGATSSINVDYLNMAMQNGCTVHTIEEDLENLAKLTEGQEFEAMGKIYHVNDGKIKLKTSIAIK